MLSGPITRQAYTPQHTLRAYRCAGTTHCPVLRWLLHAIQRTVLLLLLTASLCTSYHTLTARTHTLHATHTHTQPLPSPASHSTPLPHTRALIEIASHTSTHRKGPDPAECCSLSEPLPSAQLLRLRCCCLGPARVSHSAHSTYAPSHTLLTLHRTLYYPHQPLSQHSTPSDTRTEQNR